MSDPRRETAQKARKQGFGGNRETETAGRPWAQWPIPGSADINGGDHWRLFVRALSHNLQVASYWAAENVRESINQIGLLLSSLFILGLATQYVT